MKKSEAAQDLRNMMIAIQKYRANIAELWGGAFDDTLKEQWPWIWGDSCPLPALSKILDAYDQDGTLSPMDYYNQMTILYSFTPEVMHVFTILGARVPPEPKLQQWEEEDGNS